MAEFEVLSCHVIGVTEKTTNFHRISDFWTKVLAYNSQIRNRIANVSTVSLVDSDLSC
jgi:hypothetical protein